jgi:hypothetical protein
MLPWKELLNHTQYFPDIPLDDIVSPPSVKEIIDFLEPIPEPVGLFCSTKIQKEKNSKKTLTIDDINKVMRLVKLFRDIPKSAEDSKDCLNKSVD